MPTPVALKEINGLAVVVAATCWSAEELTPRQSESECPPLLLVSDGEGIAMNLIN